MSITYFQTPVDGRESGQILYHVLYLALMHQEVGGVEQYGQQTEWIQIAWSEWPSFREASIAAKEFSVSSGSIERWECMCHEWTMAQRMLYPETK